MVRVLMPSRRTGTIVAARAVVHLAGVVAVPVIPFDVAQVADADGAALGRSGLVTWMWAVTSKRFEVGRSVVRPGDVVRDHAFSIGDQTL